MKLNPFSFDKDNKTMLNPLSMSMPMMHFSMNDSIFDKNNWMSVYNTNTNNNNFGLNHTAIIDKIKMNVVFKTSRGLKLNIIIDPDKTISDLIRLFFIRVDKEELFQRNDVIFIWNAQKLEYNDNTKIRNYFRLSFQPTIIANDLRDLIGA